MVTTSASPSARRSTARGEARRRLAYDPTRAATGPLAPRRAPLRVPMPEADAKPILWPVEFKQTLPVGRPIRLESAAPTKVPFFNSLNYDVRRAVYDVFLSDIGLRQQIFCPSIDRNAPTRQIFGRFLISKQYDNAAFKTTLSCGHWDCVAAAEEGASAKSEQTYRLADLVALMRTCKSGYLDVSEYLYRSVTFTFAGTPELRAFVDRTPASVLAKIRAVAFVAHALPNDPAACQRFIRGEYFQTEGEDAIALFKQFTHLELLEVNFFPSLILALSNKLKTVMEPLNQLSDVSRIIVRVPTIRYEASSGSKLPIIGHLGTSTRFELQRPAVAAGQVALCCKAYTYSF